MDIDTRLFIKSGYRITKDKGLTAARIRVPGGDLDTKFLPKIIEVARKYGTGVIHLTSRQSIEIPYLDINKVDKIKAELAKTIYGIEELSGASLEFPEKGYKTIGSRNIVACIGNRVCRYAAFDTTALAKEIESRFFENDYHLKIGITGCPNDCAKIWVHDIGVMGLTLPENRKERCISCEACFKDCNTYCHGAIEMKERVPVRDEEKCTYCALCVLACPTTAWTRKKKMYRIVIGGRTGKKEVRLAHTFIDFLTEKEVIFKIIDNTFKFIDRFVDRSLKKEHLGYIIDREGFTKYKEHVLKDVVLNKEALVGSGLDIR